MAHAVPPRTTARRFLTTGTAARLAACHPVTILRAIERGELEAVRLGPSGDHRIAPEALEEWLRPAGPGGAA
jgi:excisionase family DNA binding protein